MGVMKGACTFPAKANMLVEGGAAVGVMVNSVDGTMEPSGKEDLPSYCSDGHYT